MALYLKYRRTSLDELVGMDGTVKAIQTYLNRKKKEDIPHFYLLSGPAGTGKTTIARCMAAKLGCDPMFVTEYNCANTNGIDLIREVEAQMGLRPFKGTAKAYIFDEAHELTTPAQENLLKPTEEPPSGVYFFLCTTAPEALNKQLVNRATPIFTKPISDDDMVEVVLEVADCENITITKKVLDKIVDCAEGSSRTALVFLDMIRDLNNEDDMLAALQEATVNQEEVKALCQTLMAGTIQWAEIVGVLNGLKGVPAEKVRRAILGYAQAVILRNGGKAPNGRAACILEAFEEPTYNIGMPGVVLACIRVFANA